LMINYLMQMRKASYAEDPDYELAGQLLERIGGGPAGQAQNKANDKFYINYSTGSVRWLYYNPDSNAGGQYVELISDFGLIREAADADDDFFVYLEGCCRGYLIDAGTEEFPLYDDEFNNSPCDFEGCSEATKTALIAAANAGFYKNNKPEAPRAAAIRFSRVRLWSETGEEAEFFMPGAPESYEDIEDHEDCIEFKEFLEQAPGSHMEGVSAYITTFTEGAGEPQPASRADIERIYNAVGETDIIVIAGWEVTGERSFVFDYGIGENLGMGGLQ